MTRCQCEGHGVVRMAYQSGEVFDLALCICLSGQRLRARHEAHPAWLPTAFGLTAETRIAWLEDFEGDSTDAPAGPIVRGDFLEAGRVGKRARL